MQMRAAAPVEPVLEMDEIQGIVVPGFLKPYHTLLGLRLKNAGEAGARKFAVLVRRLSFEVSTGVETFRDRENFRKARLALRTRYPRSKMEYTHGDEGAVLVGIGFSYRGLSLLTPGAGAIRSQAFRAGMVARSAALGDPQGRDDPGFAKNWVVGAPGKELDALVVVAGDHREPVTKRADVLQRWFDDCGVTVIYREDGNVRQTPQDERGHEHFGFDDGVSQPAIRGRVQLDGHETFISQRNVDPRVQPETWLYGRPGQTLIWPGEFVLGQPRSSPDPLLPGPPAQTTPLWTRNGSFLVFRRLRQEVGLFWRTMRETAAALSKSGWKIDDAELAALLVGRWPSGAPVNRVPGGDVPKLGTNQYANNYFRFDSDSVKLAVVQEDGTPFDDPFPQSKADPLGIACPWAAHIRKVNVRDSGSDMGGGDATYTRRLLRIGIPYGTFLEGKQKYRDRGKDDRGLLFLSIQTSIEEQFEFLQTAWMNDDSRPKMPGGNDMIVGQNAAAVGGRRRCTLIDPKLRAHDVSTADQWVVPTGGGYFFVPSIGTLRDVLGRRAE